MRMRHGTDRSQLSEGQLALLKADVVGKEKETAEPTQVSSCSSAKGKTSLRRLLPAAQFVAADDVRFDAIAASSESACQGELVIYRSGIDCPTQTVADAAARGAAGILSDQLIPSPIPQCVVGDLDLALADIFAATLDRPDRRLLTIGVIGSSGKTSTTLLLATLLRGSGVRTAFDCDLGSNDGVMQRTSDAGVAAGHRLIEQLHDATDSGSQAAVIELNEADVRHGRYDAIEFDILVVTGTTTCQGDFGPSALQCALERVTPQGAVIASADDAKAVRVVLDNDCRLLTYGVRNRADLSARIMDQSGGMTTLLITHRETTAAMETSLCGPAMAANHAAAALVGLLIDIPLETSVERLSQLRSIPGRGERLQAFGESSVIVDVGGSPDRVLTSLRSARWAMSGETKRSGKLWCVLAIDPEEGADALARYGTIIERFADQVVVTSHPSSKQTFLSASHYVLDGVKKCAAFRLVADRKRAVRWALGEADPRDTVLVITGDRNETQVLHRRDIEEVKQCVEATREANRQPQETPPLKIFDPEG